MRYRVATYYRTPAYGLCGWHARVDMYDTRDEADAALNAPFRRADFRRTLHEVHPDRIPSVGRRLSDRRVSR